MGKIFDEIMESMDYFIELERGKMMLSREDVIRKMQGLECPNYLRETCYEPIQEQAIKAIELQAKLDAIERWATASVQFDDFGYQMARDSVLQILRGDGDDE